MARTMVAKLVTPRLPTATATRSPCRSRLGKREDCHYSEEEVPTSTGHERFNLLDRAIIHRPLAADSGQPKAAEPPAIRGYSKAAEGIPRGFTSIGLLVSA